MDDYRLVLSAYTSYEVEEFTLQMLDLELNSLLVKIRLLQISLQKFGKIEDSLTLL